MQKKHQKKLNSFILFVLAMFITLEEARVALGLASDDDTQDARVEKLMEDSKNVIVSLLGKIFKGSYVFDIPNCTFDGTHLSLATWNVASIDKIDGVAYVGTVDVDFEIYGVFLNRLHIGNISTQLVQGKHHHTIEVTAGYDDTDAPADLKRLQSLLVFKLDEDVTMREIESHKQWPRAWTYWKGTKASITSSIDGIVANYSLLPNT